VVDGWQPDRDPDRAGKGRLELQRRIIEAREASLSVKNQDRSDNVPGRGAGSSSFYTSWIRHVCAPLFASAIVPCAMSHVPQLVVIALPPWLASRLPCFFFFFFFFFPIPRRLPVLSTLDLLTTTVYQVAYKSKTVRYEADPRRRPAFVWQRRCWPCRLVERSVCVYASMCMSMFCVFVYICVHLCLDMCLYVDIWFVSVSIGLRFSLSMSKCIRRCVSFRIFAYMAVHLCSCVCVYMRLYMCVCVCLCVFTCICVHACPFVSRRVSLCVCPRVHL
jgi:hypothetical protein